MKKWLIGILLFISISGFTQVNLDSLFSVWNNQSIQDSTRFNALAEIIWEGYRTQKPDSAIILSQELIAFAKAAAKPIWLCKATNYLGVCYETKGDIEKSITAYDRALSIALNQNDAYWMGVLNYNLGLINKNQGNLEIATSYFLESEKHLKAYPQKSMYVDLYKQLGSLSKELGNQNDAIDYYEKALNNLKSKNDALGVLGVVSDIASIYKSINRPDLELLTRQQGLSYFEKVDYKWGIAESLTNLGILHSFQNEHEKALPYYFKSIKIYEEIGDTLRTYISIGNIGYTYFLLENFEEALKFNKKGLALSIKANDPTGIANTLETIGEVHQEDGNFDSAFYYHEKALQIRLEIGQEALSYYMLSKYYLIKNELTTALSYSDKAFEIVSRQNDFYQLQLIVKTRKEILKKLKKGMEALAMYELEIALNDSLKADEFKIQLTALEASAKFEKEQYVKEQQAKEAARLEAEKVARRNSLQYSGIGLGIFALFGLVFLFGRIKLPNWAVELSVFLPFLIFFEFLLVVSDPYVDAWSEGVPLIKLGINVVMAAAIFPLHSFFERFLKNRLFKSVP